MVLKIAERALVPPFMVMDVMREAEALEAAGRHIIHLEVGQPSTGIPRAAADQVARALTDDPLGYTLAAGMPVLRARIARHYRDTYGAAISPKRVFLTTGSSGGFVLAFLAAFAAGDRVALAAPGYPAYRHILTSLGITPVLLPVDETTRYQPTVDHLKSLPKLPDGLILASPANPTGSMILPDEFRALAAFCHNNGIRLISDEIYHGISYGVTATTVADISPSAFVVNSFSKYFSMTGWRLGWLIVPEDLQRPLECLAQNLFIAPPAVSQHGGLAVFDCRDELEANVQRYARNRDVLLRHLPESGFTRFAPADGAFYIYADIADFGEDAEMFCKRMLHEAGVATTPGVDFDPFKGQRFVRFSFAGETAHMEEACRRLAKWRKA